MTDLKMLLLGTIAAALISSSLAAQTGAVPDGQTDGFAAANGRRRAICR